MSENFQQNYHQRGNNRDSPSSNSSSTRRSATYNGNKNVSNMRNSSPASSANVASLNNDDVVSNVPSDVSVGSVVQCSIGNRSFKGEVMAFDQSVKAIIIKSAASCSRSSLNDVHILNLSLMKELKIVQENREALPDPPALNVQRLQNRLREQAERKRRQVMAFKAGISPEGQKVFQAISKTIDEIVWNGENILVMREVTVTPPYKPENVKGKTDSKALNHVKKIIEKHLSDQSSKQPVEGGRPAAVTPTTPAAADVVSVVHNNNNKSETSQQPQPAHHSASRTNSTGRFEDKSGGRPPRPGGGSRPSTQKRDSDAKASYNQ